jgi:16S rRNA (cytosine967-C5)-methyltransferase
MIAAARRAAVDALAHIDDGQLDMGAAIARARATLEDERDGALLLEIVTGTLRMRNAIDYQLALRVKRPLTKLDAAVLRILRLSAFQLMYLSRAKPSAVIHDAVELTRRAGKTSAAGLTNAVLRAVSRDKDQLSWPAADDPAHLSIIYSHPQWLIERWLTRHGPEHTKTWLAFNNQAPALCLAVNHHLTNRDALIAELTASGVASKPSERAAHGVIVTEGRALDTSAFTGGRFIVQDEASQLIGELAARHAGARALDLCASPGGKTLAISAIAKSVVACDVRPQRVRILARTLERCFVANARIVHIPAAGPLPFRDASFDLVLIDAPCSGLGTVRRDPDIKWRRSPDDFPRFAAAQRELVERASSLVRPGGTLIYSTCSSEPEENEDVVTAFLSGHAEFARRHTHQTLPYRDGLEAFFGAVLQRAV